MATEDELRAEAWERSQARRHVFRAELNARLHGSPTAVALVRKHWDPYRQWQIERQMDLPPVEVQRRERQANRHWSEN